MFIREKRRKNKDGTTVTYLQLVENRRLEGRTRQRVLATLGRTDDPKLASGLGSLVEGAARYAEVEALLLSEGTMVETKTWGPHLVWERVWEETVGPLVAEAMGHDRLFRATYLMVLHRLVDPGSKCAAFRFAQDTYGADFDGLGLHDLYRALDLLTDTKDEIERRWFSRHQELFTETDLVYFDTTTSYLEGTHPEELAQFGYSHDRRPDRRQIGIGVALTREGIPVFHLVLPGDRADPGAFQEAIAHLKRTLGIGRVILCCDRGMVRKKTILALREAEFPYLVATRLRRDKAAQRVLSQPGRYQVIEESLWVKEVHLPGEEDRYFLCYSPKGAEEDRRTREAIVAHLQREMAKGMRGLLRDPARRYLRALEGKAELDWEAIQEDARYDGKWVLRTNTELSAKEAALAYKGLWQVEQAFRVMKTPLELRPIYHWTEKRVRGHVMVCFLAFLLRTVLKKRLEGMGWQGSFTELVEGLARVRATVVEDERGKRYRLRDEIPACCMPAFQALRTTPPRRLERLA